MNSANRTLQSQQKTRILRHFLCLGLICYLCKIEVGERSFGNRENGFENLWIWLGSGALERWLWNAWG